MNDSADTAKGGREKVWHCCFFRVCYFVRLDEKSDVANRALPVAVRENFLLGVYDNTCMDKRAKVSEVYF